MLGAAGWAGRVGAAQAQVLGGRRLDGAFIQRGTACADKLDATALMRLDDRKPPVESCVAAAAS
jgi:hypothetical protein